MPLPISRDETAVPGGRIRSALLNGLQDWIVGLYHGNRLPGTRLVAPSEMMGMPSVWSFVALAAGTAALRGWTANDSGVIGDPYLVIPIPLEVGDRVTGVRVHCYGGAGSGSAALIAELWRDTIPASGAGTAFSTPTSFSNDVGIGAAEGYQTITLTGITAPAIAAGESWFVSVVPMIVGVNLTVIGAEIDFDHPL